MIYLDSAATTLQKPPAVAQAMAKAVNTLASPGRGGYPAAMEAARTAFSCRELAAGLFDVEAPEQVVFTSSATHGLNIAIRSLVKPGGTVVISGYEHNAVTRTLASIPEVKVRVARAALFRPAEMVEAFRQALDETVSAVICCHVSNVFGYVLPAEAVAALCRQRGIPFILDAAQSAGCIPISLRKLGAAYIAMPGHKGLYGPQGTGLLLCGVLPEPLITGGTGSNSALPEMPDFLPDRLEAGTHNIPGIAGLLEGMRYVAEQGTERILEHERRLTQALAAGLAELPGVTVYATPALEAQAGVVSFVVDGWDVEEAGDLLGQRGIALRAGLHCAPLAHESAGTLQTGTLRASLSAFSQAQECGALIREVERLVRS